MSDFTQLLQRAQAGDPTAWNEVVVLIYDDLRRIARQVLRGNANGTLSPTALVHDCYLRLAAQGPPGVVDRNHFMALAARAMRQLMLNHARDRLAAKRGGGASHTGLSEHEDAVANEASSLLSLESALEQLEREEANWARVIECRVFAGMSEEETAQALSLPLRSTQRLWSQARGRLEVLLDA